MLQLTCQSVMNIFPTNNINSVLCLESFEISHFIDVQIADVQPHDHESHESMFFSRKWSDFISYDFLYVSVYTILLLPVVVIIEEFMLTSYHKRVSLRIVDLHLMASCFFCANGCACLCKLNYIANDYGKEFVTSFIYRKKFKYYFIWSKSS